MSSPPDAPPTAAELDAYLDGELELTERTRIEEALAGNASLAEQLEQRRHFLHALQRVAAEQRAQLALPAGLAGRIQAALTHPPQALPLRRLRPLWRAAAAACLLIGVGATVLLWGRDPEAQALPYEIRAAAALLDRTLTLDAGSACAEGPTSPQHFPPVREQVWRVGRCLDGRPSAIDTRALLFRPEDTVRLGYVAIPEEGSGSGPEIGMTAVGETLVFDLSYGRTRYFLAAPRAFVEEQGTCAACHGTVARASPNPHKIVQRAWQR